MATWTENARKAWAAGIRSEKKNGLDSQQLITLREDINAWVDRIDLSAQKKLSMGKYLNAPLFATITAESQEVKEVVFSGA